MPQSFSSDFLSHILSILTCRLDTVFDFYFLVYSWAVPVKSPKWGARHIFCHDRPGKAPSSTALRSSSNSNRPSTIYNTSVPFHFESKPALVAYVPAASRPRNHAPCLLAAIEGGASIIELGVPFSDPPPGPVIQRASERALKHGTSLQQVLTLASVIREHSQSVGLDLSYLNPILRMGLAKFCQVARLAGIDGTLITDFPVENPPRICVKLARTSWPLSF